MVLYMGNEKSDKHRGSAAFAETQGGQTTHRTDMKRLAPLFLGGIAAALLLAGCKTQYSEYKPGMTEPHLHGHVHYIPHLEDQATNSRSYFPPPSGGGTNTIFNPLAFLQITHQPEDRIAEEGTLVMLAVSATNSGPPIQYQWEKNGVEIAGETKRELVFTNVAISDVASYRVQVFENPTNVLYSTEAHLSVYTLAATNSITGTLYTPIGAFTTSGGGGFSCAGGSFTKAYSPREGGTYHYFYGPNAGPQYGPFQNYSQSSRLSLHTMGLNGTMSHGMSLRRNFPPTLPAIQEAKSTSTSGGTFFTPVTLSLSSGTDRNSYQLTLFCNPPPMTSVVAFTWLYF